MEARGGPPRGLGNYHGGPAAHDPEPHDRDASAHLTARGHAQRLNPKTRTPAPTRRMPAHSRGVGRS
jgi:hypothetical protein